MKKELLRYQVLPLDIKPSTPPMPISQAIHQQPKIPAMIARIMIQSAAPVLVIHFEALTTNKPKISTASPHQNAVIAYSGYQISAKIPSIASPPAITKIIPPIIAIAKAIPPNAKINSPPEKSTRDKIMLEALLRSFLLAHLKRDSLRS
jgi:hypothetical protein